MQQLFGTQTSENTNASSKFSSAASSVLDGIDGFYTITKQYVLESLGKVKTTTDPEFQSRLDKLHQIKKQYEEISSLGSSFFAQFAALNETMKQFGSKLTEIGVNEKEEFDELLKLGEAYRSVAKASEVDQPRVDRFSKTITAARTKAIDDTYETVKRYEKSRLEYDAYLAKLEEIKRRPGTQKVQDQIAQISEELNRLKTKYEKLRADVIEKVDMLNMKRESDFQQQLKTQQKCLSTFHNAVEVLLSPNQQQIAKVRLSETSSNDTTNGGRLLVFE